MILSGRGTIVFEHDEKRTEAGDSFYLPGGTPHGFRVPKDGPPVLMINFEAGTAILPTPPEKLPRNVRGTSESASRTPARRRRSK